MKTLFRISESAGSKKKLKVVFFGLGSIGSRLARLIRDNFDYDLFALRTTKDRPNDLGIYEIYDEKELGPISADIAFITNPTSLHVDTAIKCVGLGMHLFIEKPLSNILEKLDMLIDKVREAHILSYVACNLRFDPIIQHLKKTLDFDDLFYARTICSSYLPEWRPGQDYRQSYSVGKALGGGVILDLIHETDYCNWLFGPIDKVTGNAGRVSNLEIDTEDYADMTLCHSNGFISNVHVDYFGRKSQRKIEIFGNNIQIEADLLKRRVAILHDGHSEVQSFDDLHKDYTYTQELKYFFQCLSDHEVPMNNIEEHITVLKPVLEFKENLGL